MIIFSVLRSSLEKSTSPSIPFPDTLKGVDDLIRISLEGFRNSCFNWLLAATFLVVAGLVFEGPELWHEISSIVRHWRFGRRFHFSLPEEQTPNRAKLLAFVGWTLIVLGVAGEFVADSFVSKADGFVQKFDEILLSDAQKKTGAASERAAMAFERAAQTEREASQENERAAKAEQQASEENARAAKALEAAEIARTNAEGLSLQIAQANERAANAEKRTAEAEVELARLKLPRSLTRVPELISALGPFKGTEYVFVSVFQDEESIYLLRAIDDVLQKAGWTRGKSVGGFPGINIYGSEPNNFSVPVGVNIGVQVSTDSPKDVDTSLKIEELPQYLQAAITLHVGLSSCLFPSSNNSTAKVVNVQKGTSTTIRIAVGRKP
jgi:hypothetical protein